MTTSAAIFDLGQGAPVLAFDVGGTDTKSAVIPANGVITRIGRSKTARSDAAPAEAVLDDIAIAIPRLIEELGEEPAAIGLSVPGLVDEQNGIGLFSANLGWRDVPFRELAFERFGYPVAFGHDVRAAGEAELLLGAAKGLNNVVTLAIGTGIAGAIMINGHPLIAGGYAGELGHTLADPNGELCPCGARGCLETIASAGAIARRYALRTGQSTAGSREVMAAVHSGDPIAHEVWQQAVDALGRHIARLAAILAPEAIIIGGGLAEAGDDLFAPLNERIEELLSFHRRPRLIKAALGEQAGVLGTALAARDLAASA